MTRVLGHPTAVSAILRVVARPITHPRPPLVGGCGVQFDGKIFDAIAYDDPQKPCPGLVEDLTQLYHLSRGRGNLFHGQDIVAWTEDGDGSP